MPSHNKTPVIVVLCFVASLLCVLAQDSPATDTEMPTNSLTANSSVDDVIEYAKSVANKIIAQHPNDRMGMGIHSTDPYLGPLSVVNHTALIDALAQLPPLPQFDHNPHIGDELEVQFQITQLSSYLLKGAISKFAARTDIGDLLAANTNYTLSIIGLRKFQDDPRVTGYLINTLNKYQTSPPIQENLSHIQDSDVFYQTLLLANMSSDPKVAKALADLMIKATNDPSTPGLYIQFLLVTSGIVHDEKIYGLFPQIVLNLVTNFSPDVFTQDFVIDRILPDPAKELTTNPDIAAAVLAYLKKAPSTPPTNPANNNPATPEMIKNWESETTVEMAYFGDPDAFGKVINSDPAGKYPVFLKKKFIDTVLYSGPGDKLSALKDNYAKAVYLKGTWSLTMPGFPAPAAPSTATAATTQIATPEIPAINATSTANAPTETQSPSPPASPQSQTSSPLPVPASVGCTITRVAPLEAYAPDGSMTGVSQSAIGQSYQCLRVEGDKAVLKDANGNIFKIETDAVSQVPR